VSPGGQPAPTRRSGAILALLLLGGATYALSQTLILPAMPEFVRTLDATPLATSWLLTAYLVAASVATPLIGRLGDLLGRGRVLRWVMLGFCAGSVVCALADSLAVLMLGRVVQGVAGGILPLAYGIIRDTFPGASRMRAIGSLSVSLGVGAALGPPLAGFTLSVGGPSTIFWIGMLGAVPAIFAGRLVPDAAKVSRARVDWLGAGLLSGALAGLLTLTTQGRELGWTSVAAVALVVATVGLSVAWVVAERRHPRPLVDLGLLRRPTVALTNVAALCVGCGIFMVYAPLAPMAQAPTSTGSGLGLSVAAAGALLIPHGVAQIVVGPWVGSLCGRIGPRATLMSGAGLNAATIVAMTVEHSTPASLLVGGGVLGIGQALALTAMAELIVTAVPHGDVGIATGVNGVMRTIGMALGSALSAALLASGGELFPSDHAYVAAFSVGACATAAAVACAVAIPAAAGRVRLHPGVPDPQGSAAS
jgi:MFS family permease